MTTLQNNSINSQPVSKGQGAKAAVLAALLASSTFAFNGVANADIGATHTSLVSEFASFNTPGVVDGRVEAIAIDGDTVFVGGTFTQIHDPLSDEILDQAYIFAYSKSTGDLIRDFDPVLNNSVHALEVTGDGTGVFAGGVFNVINGESNRRGIVKIGNDGNRAPGFGARADALVKTLVRLGNKLYVGGNFSSISNTPVENLAVIDTTTGAVLPDVNLDFDGVISTTRTPNGVQSVDDIDITSDGKLLVAAGNFSIVDGQSRHRLVLVELDGGAQVSNWNTDIFDVQCGALLFPQYIRGIDIAPDDSYFVTGSTGARSRLNPACDTLLRFELDDLTLTDAQPTWINFTGGDTFYDVVATDHAIYAGGHFRWLDNFNSINGHDDGEGSTDRLGLAAFDPLNGLTLQNWRSDRNPRGLGTFALIAEPEGLYIGDDTDFLNGTEHKKLKFLPVSNNTVARPDAPVLPTTLISNTGSGLSATDYNGNALGTSVQLDNTAFADATAGMVVGGHLFYTNTAGVMQVAPITDSALGNSSVVDLLGLTSAHWAMNNLGGMYFDYDWSRVYYTKRGDSQLYYRAFSPDGTFFGDREVVAEQQGDILWADVTGMDVIEGQLYFTRTDGYMYRAQIDGPNVVVGTTVQVSGPAVDGVVWNNNMLSFLGEGTVIEVGGSTDAQIRIDSSGDSAGAGRFRQFDIPVTAGETTELRLDWLDPAANLRLFVRDANDVLVASDTSVAGSPKYLTIPAGIGGTYVVSVLVAEGNTSYSLLVNPTDERPEPAAEFVFSSAGTDDAANGRFQTFRFDVVDGEMIDVDLIWDDANADVRLFLRDENNTQVARDTAGVGSAFVSHVAMSSGTYSVGVSIRNAADVVDYDVLVNTTGDDNPIVVVPPTIVNLAPIGTATQSSTRVGGVPSRAIDGNTSGVYRQNSVTRTARSLNPWWQVQLAEQSTIETINVFNRTDACCTDRLSNYSVTVLNAAGQTVFSQFYSGAPSPSNSINVGRVVGNTVRVQINGNGVLSLAEVNVLGYTQ